MSSNSLSLEVFSLCVVLSVVRTVYASIHIASMSILYSNLATHLRLSVKHSMVLHLVHGACTASVV